MKIIEAASEHLEDVYELICELENGTVCKEKFSQIYQNNLKNNNIYYIIAFDGLKAIGFASLHIQQLIHHCAKIGELQEIIISKQWQGNGVGSELFNYAKEIALDNDCLQLEVCCNMSREKSHRFYLKQGMKKSHFKFTYSLKTTSDF